MISDGRVFVGPTGVRQPARLLPDLGTGTGQVGGLTGIHVDDLRHTGNHLAAMSGATTRELMGRMGHVSVDAALVYQHRTATRDRAIADSMGAMIAALNGP